MSKSSMVLMKLARNAKMLGLTLNSESATQFVVENGSNDLTVSYENLPVSPAVLGGVDPSVSPFLGIGVGAPGKIKIKSSINTNTSVTDVLNSEVAAKLLALCASMANDIVLENSDASWSMMIRGHSDLLGMGQ
jgi:hypothetical protein